MVASVLENSIDSIVSWGPAEAELVSATMTCQDSASTAFDVDNRSVSGVSSAGPRLRSATGPFSCYDASCHVCCH